MSASNWVQCPRCSARTVAALTARAAEVAAMYGNVPVDQFDAAREDLAARELRATKTEPTFREDYEIFGAADGVVTVQYSGSCRTCGLSLDFDEERPIPGLATS